MDEQNQGDAEKGSFVPMERGQVVQDLLDWHMRRMRVLKRLLSAPMMNATLFGGPQTAAFRRAKEARGE